MEITVVNKDAEENYHFPCECFCSDPLSNPMYLKSDTTKIDIDKMAKDIAAAICVQSSQHQIEKIIKQYLQEKLHGK